MINDNTWNQIRDKVPNITINGTKLHKSSKTTELWIHAKWTAKKGLIILQKDIESFDGENVVLRESRREL